MSEWKEYKLSDIAEITTGFPFKGNKYTNTGIRVVRGENVTIGDLRWDTIKCWNEDFDQFAKYSLKKGDVVIGMDGSRVGKNRAQIRETDLPLLLAQRVACVRAKIGYSQDLIAYLIKSNRFERYVEMVHTGTSIPHISQKQIEEFTITIPKSFTTQTSIAEILSSLDDKIELNNKINQELEALAQTLFKQWFIDFEFPNENGEPYKSSGGEMVDSELGEIPKGWEVGYLEDVIEFHNGYSFTSKELESEFSNESYHVFKMGHIKKGGGLNAEGTKSYFSKSKAQKLSKYVLKKGDLLMCMTDMKGNVALLGHTALMNEDDKYIVNQRVGLLRPKNNVGIDYPYLYILTNSFDFIEELRSRANSGVQVNLSTNEIKKSKILIAPKSINEKFDLITKSFYDKIFEITNQNETLRNTRDFLLPKLISGELEINEINN